MRTKTNTFKEATTREAMKPFNVWLPVSLHRDLALARVEDGVAMNEAIREAIQLWLARRKQRRRARRRP